MYPHGWPDVLEIDQATYRYTQDQEKILTALALANEAQNTDSWSAVICYPMEEQSQLEFLTTVAKREISGFGLMVLANLMIHAATGIPLLAASTLASQIRGSWFPFASWAAHRGTRLSDLSIPELLAACYSWQLYACREEKDIASLNRRIFGRSQPWGR